jgi:hypothetical protein
MNIDLNIKFSFAPIVIHIADLAKNGSFTPSLIMNPADTPHTPS